MSPIREIISFARKREPWQQDLIRKIYTQDKITKQDIDDALLMLKACHDIIPTQKAPCPECLSDQHTPPDINYGPRVILNSLSNLKHVNRLAHNQTLSFAINGLTIIYGDNGSGKSGYCRVIKKLCRICSGGEEKILGNAFDDNEVPPAEATVRFSVEEKKGIKEFQWLDGKMSPPELYRISVFDSKAVPLYADKENQIEFLPYDLDVLPRLGKACRVLSAHIDDEINKLTIQISSSLPDFPSPTTVSNTINKLILTTPIKQLPTVDELQKIAEWNDQLQKELDKIEKTLNTDSQTLANRCRQLELAVTQLCQDVDNAQAALGDEVISHIKEKCLIAIAARKAADMAAAIAFGNEPLGGVGSKTWRLMFTYARQYSEIAYPKEPFPVTGLDKRCVLCQQLLDSEASERLKRFDEFIKNTAEEEAQKHERLIEDAIVVLQSFRPRPSSEVQALLLGMEAIDHKSTGLKEKVVQFFDAVSRHHQSLLKILEKQNNLNKIDRFPASPRQDLVDALSRLGQLIINYEKSQKSGASETTGNKTMRIIG